MPKLSTNILEEINGLGIDAKSIKQILLTHHDVDHVGNAKELQEATGAELWASNEDVPYILGSKNRPGVKRIVQTLVKYGKPTIKNIYSKDQTFGELKVIKTPGHTPGHVIFAYKNILFTGDLFKIIDGSITIMPKYMNYNHNELEKSISKLKYLDYDWICPSHGEPMKRDRVLQEFINKF